MDSFALYEFQRLLTDTWQNQGWNIPREVTYYTSELLAEHVEKPDWEPKPSYAEVYLQMRSTNTAKQLGDACFFARAVFPEYKQRRGISSDYFVQIGQGSYDLVLRNVDHPAIKILRDHFEFCAEAVWTAVHAHGKFRSMWD